MIESSRETFSIWIDLNFFSFAFYGIIHGIGFAWFLAKIRDRITVTKLKFFVFLFLFNFCLRVMPILLISNLFAAHWFTMLKISDQFKSHCSLIVVTFIMLAKICGWIKSNYVNFDWKGILIFFSFKIIKTHFYLL